jgi:Na+/H+-dicarboxylate symporter
MKFPLAARIVVGMMLGIATGVACHAMLPNADAANQVGGYFSLLAEVFLRLVKMIIAPLVFCSLVIGVTKIGDVHAVGRISGRWAGFSSRLSSRSRLAR